jgi:hypothetical protein
MASAPIGTVPPSADRGERGRRKHVPLTDEEKKRRSYRDFSSMTAHEKALMARTVHYIIM